MRTFRCSSRLLGEGVSAQEGVSAWGCLLREMAACQGVSACRGGVWQTPSLLMDRILDTHLWKHYLSATSFMDCNNEICNLEIYSHLLTSCGGNKEGNCKFMGIERWQYCPFCVFVKHSNNLKIFRNFNTTVYFLSNIVSCNWLTK